MIVVTSMEVVLFVQSGNFGLSQWISSHIHRLLSLNLRILSHNHFSCKLGWTFGPQEQYCHPCNNSINFLTYLACHTFRPSHGNHRCSIPTSSSCRELFPWCYHCRGPTLIYYRYWSLILTRHWHNNSIPMHNSHKGRICTWSTMLRSSL